MIYSIKRSGNIISKIIFHLSISTIKKKKKNLGAFDWYYSIIIYLFFEIKDRNSILFSSDLYYSNFCIVCKEDYHDNQTLSQIYNWYYSNNL